jgi:hypothetical protein
MDTVHSLGQIVLQGMVDLNRQRKKGRRTKNQSKHILTVDERHSLFFVHVTALSLNVYHPREHRLHVVCFVASLYWPTTHALPVKQNKKKKTLVPKK